MKVGDEQGQLRSVALQNAQSILAARERAEQALLEAKRDLEESRQLLEAALSAAGAGAFKWRLADDAFVLDDNLQKMLSLESSPDGRSLTVLALAIAAEDRERFVDQFLRAFRQGDELDGEFRLADTAPTAKWIEARGRHWRDEAGNIAWFVGTITDISRRKQDEAALHESNEVLRGTFNQAAVGIAIACLDETMDVVNDKFIEILGYSREQLRHLSFRDFTHADDRELTEGFIRRLVSGEINECALEKRYIRADGSTMWSHTTVTLLRDADGKARRFIGAINDISQRKDAERALEEETRVLELLNQTNATLVSHLDLESLVQSVTDATTQLSGARFGAFFYTGTDEQGEAMLLYALSGAPRSAFETLGHPRSTALFGPTLRGEATIRSEDILAEPRYGKSAPHFGMPPGHPPVRSYLAVPVKSRNGDAIGGLFFGHPDVGVFTGRAERIVSGIAAQAAVAIDNARLYEDVRRGSAERDRLLEAERAARSQAQRASLMKDEFLSTLSHELRTPLSAVLGWAQILLAKQGEPEIVRRGAETIASNAKVQAKLIDDLLDMNRIVSGKVRLDVQPTWLEGVVDAAMDVIRPSADAKGIALRKIVDPRAGPVSGDATRLQQVVWNLLSNAVKFTGRGGTVQLQVARVKSHVEISVSDNGIGISEEFLPYVFDRFRQADSSTTRSVGGLGLGLAIVKQLVELHGGHVRAFSEGEDKGTTILITLPMAPVFGEALGSSSAAGANPRPPNAFDVDLAGARVLVVDDEPDASAIVSFVLSQSKATVVTADGVDEALRLLDAERFDLLVSDIGMPGKDGYHLMRELRRRPPDRGGAIPAVALTAFARAEDRTRAMLAGYQVHLSKPVEPWELVATVASLLGRFGDK